MGEVSEAGGCPFRSPMLAVVHPLGPPPAGESFVQAFGLVGISSLKLFRIHETFLSASPK